MILVDSSVWIDFFNGVSSPATGRLDDTLGCEEVVTGDLILTEVLQGFRRDRDYDTAKNALTALKVHEMLGFEMAVRTAENVRKLRKKGITVGKTADAVIATYCVEKKLALLFSDKDFRPFVKYLGLRSVL